MYIFRNIVIVIILVVFSIQLMPVSAQDRAALPDNLAVITPANMGQTEQLTGSNLLHPHDMHVDAVAFSPYLERHILATGGGDGKVRVWDLDSTVSPQILEDLETLDSSSSGTATWISSLAFDTSGTKLAAGYHTGVIRVWVDSQSALGTTTTTPALKRIHPAEGQRRSEVTALAFNLDDNRQLAVGWADGTVAIWDISGAPERLGQTHTQDWVTSLVFGNNQVLVGTKNGLQALDDATLTEAGIVTGLDHSQSNTVLNVPRATIEKRAVWIVAAIKSAEGHDPFKPHEVTFNHPMRHVLAGHTAKISGLVINDQGVAVTSSWDGTVRLWDVDSDDMDSPASVVLDPYADHVMGRLWVRDVAFSYDGKVIASAGWDGVARLWGVP